MMRIGGLLRLLVFLAIAVPGEAQPSGGSVSGAVTASTGLPLPGVSVTLRDIAGGTTRTVETEFDGRYVFPNLPLQGTYEIQAALQGFATAVHANVSLAERSRAIVDFTLYAATAEALVVTGQVVPLEHQRSAVQQTIGDELMHALPLASRDFLALTSLTAGFTGKADAPSPEGQIYWSNNVLVDGASHFSKWRGAARTFYAGYGLESVREVQVLTSQFSAEYGEALATVTLAVTKSGTNTVRGSALLFAQHSALNDIPAFTPTKPPSSSERFGGTLGGPVLQDRTHFFTSYEGHVVRGSRIVTSPAASGARARNDQDEHLLFAKVDHKVTSRDMLTVRYNGQWFDWHDEPGGLVLPGTGTSFTNDVHTLLVSDTGLISNRTFNQARFQFSRYTDIRRDLQPTVFVSRSGYSIEGGTLGPYGFGANPEDTWEGSDSLSYLAGTHAVKIGGGIKHASAHTQALKFGNGAYFFGGAPQSYPSPVLFIQSLTRSAAEATADPHSTALFGFVQDDWAIRPRLTLNLGLRYDVEKISNVRHYDAPTDTNNLQPRLGAAWQAIPRRLVLRGGVGVYTQQHLLGYINRVALDAADGTSLLTIAPNSGMMPVFPALLSVFPALPSALSTAPLPPRDIRVLDPAFRNPRSLQATVGAQHSLFGMLIGTDVVYLRGLDLMSLVDTNAPASIPKRSTRSVEEADLTRPIVPVPNGFRKIVALGNKGRSWYRALEVKAERAVGKLQVIGSYTFAHADDMANDVVNDRLPEDSRNLPAEKGRADNDVRHNLSVGLSWQIPEHHRWAQGVTLSAAALFRSSRPYTITWGDDRFGTSQNDARPGGRNTGKGDSFRTVDLSIAKRFRAASRSLELRAEAFDLLATTNFDEYNGVLSSPYFGLPVSAFPRRVIQLAAIVRF